MQLRCCGFSTRLCCSADGVAFWNSCCSYRPAQHQAYRVAQVAAGVQHCGITLNEVHAESTAASPTQRPEHASGRAQVRAYVAGEAAAGSLHGLAAALIAHLAERPLAPDAAAALLALEAYLRGAPWTLNASARDPVSSACSS